MCGSAAIRSASASAKAGLAHPRLGRDQHHPAASGLRLCPAAEQQFHLLVAADQRRGADAAPRTGPSSGPRLTTSRQAPAPAEPFSSTRPEVLALEQAADLPPGGSVDHHLPGPARPCRRAARFGVSPTAVCWRESPEPIGSPMTTSPVAMPMRTCSVRRARRLADRGGNGEAGPHGAFGIGLPRLRPAEIDQHPVTHVARNEAVELPDRGRRRTPDRSRMTSPQILGIEPRRERGGADEIAEHHAERAASRRPVPMIGRHSRGRPPRAMDPRPGASAAGAPSARSPGDRLKQFADDGLPTSRLDL